IYLIFNKIDTNKYDIYVIDDGSGMDSTSIENYTKIGFQRRKSLPNKDTVMGRKGIGKLAALFLSDNYDLLTKTKDTSPLFFNFNFKQYDGERVDETPKLETVESYEFNSILKSFIGSSEHYTAIYI